MKKTVLITGCSSGIGYALAECFHNKGYLVYATARNTNKIKALEEKGILCEKLDILDTNSINGLRQKIHANGHQVDILINNAGVGSMGPIIELSESELLNQFNTNVFGPIQLIQAFSEEMINQRAGTIVNIGSVSGILTTPFAGAYCASKAALHSMSEALRMELSPFNIEVIIVQPGAIKSSFGDNAQAQVERTLKENSFYLPIRKAILSRAQASQQNPTPAIDFADELVKALEKKNTPDVLRIGNGSKWIPLLPRVFPSGILDKLLSKSFKLENLS